MQASGKMASKMISSEILVCTEQTISRVCRIFPGHVFGRSNKFVSFPGKYNVYKHYFHVYIVFLCRDAKKRKTSWSGAVKWKSKFIYLIKLLSLPFSKYNFLKK